MQQPIDEAKSRGIPVALRVLKPNPATRFYEKLSFRVVSADETYYYLEKSSQPIAFFERQKATYKRGDDMDEKRKKRIFKEAYDEIKRGLGMKPPCNECGSKNVVRILYGLTDLDEKMMRMIDEGKITLGGCMIDEDPPKWVCKDCKHKYGTLG
jgi:hypothetical protein